MNKQQNKLNDKAHYNIWIILAVYGSVLIVYSYREGYVICKTFEILCMKNDFGYIAIIV